MGKQIIGEGASGVFEGIKDGLAPVASQLAKKVGMKLVEVEAIIGKAKRYRIEEYDPNEKYLSKSKEEWANSWGKNKRAVYDYETALVLNYTDDILDFIGVCRPAKAYLDG